MLINPCSPFIVQRQLPGRIFQVTFLSVSERVVAPAVLVLVLGAICGSAISMDLLAQSMDPYSAQKSMDCADICGSLRSG